MCATLHLDNFKLPIEHTSADQDLLLLVEQKMFGRLGSSIRREALTANYYRTLNL